MSTRAVNATLFLVLGVFLPGISRATLPAGRGVLLPIQDRLGNPALAERTEVLLRAALEPHAKFAPAEDLRGVLRYQRIRDASQEPRDRLQLLAADLDADWFFLATLHDAESGRLAPESEGPPSSDLFDDSGQTPRVVLSAQVFAPAADELWWAGFAASTGRDRERAFGLGRIVSLEKLLQVTVLDLVDHARDERSPRSARSSVGRRPAGFLRATVKPSSNRVAVIPFDSVAEPEALLASEVATAALYAALEEHGFQVLLPGIARDIRQAVGLLQPGASSRSEWEALARNGGVRWVATGTVESYRRGGGRIPDPWIAFHLRFLNAESGKIHWQNGLERTGHATGGPFDRGRIYSTGDLTYEMMKSLLGGIRVDAGTRETASEN